MDTTLLIVMAIVWGILISVLSIFLVLKAKRKRAMSGVALIKEANKRNNLFLFYKIFTSVPIVKKEFARVRDRIKLLYPADEVSINIEATRFMSRASIIFFVIIVISIVFSGGDLYYLAFGIFIAFVMFRGSINSRLDKAEHRLLNQFAEFLSDLISVYREKHGHLDDAIYSMLDELPYFIGLHITKIYEVIKSPHLQEAAAAYSDYSPNTFLMSFVSLVVPTKIYGDKELPDGNTTFVKGLMNLKKQLNEEILKRERIDLAFSSLTTISLVSVVTIKPIEWFFMTFMSQTKTFFNSAIGTAAMTVIFVASYLAYTLILSLKTTKRSDIKEETVFSRIASHPVIAPILNIQYKKHYTKFERIDKEMKSVGDHSGVKAHIVKCSLLAMAVFIVMHVLFITADIQSARTTLNDFNDEFENTVVPNESYTETMRDLSKELTNQHKRDRNLDREVLAQEIRDKKTQIKGDDYVYAVADLVIEKNDKYHSIYFKWWYELIAFLVAAISFLVPTFILRFRAKAMLMSREDEVNSFNLLAMIFMDMDGIQVSTLLEWMERFSYYYRDPIMECAVTLPMGKRKALEKLMTYDNMPDFRKFVKCMINIDEVGFKKAFSDIEIQQDYYNEKRKVDNERMIAKKKTLAERIAFTPMYVTIAIWLILPMIMYAYALTKQFAQSISAF